MLRPLRINIPNGWSHVYHRGTEDRRILRDARDREHFLELLEAMRERCRVSIHTYVLMKTHCHWVVQCPDANPSACGGTGPRREECA